MTPFSSYVSAVAYLDGLSNLPAKHYMQDQSDPSIYLKRLQSFLDLVGHPEKDLKCIHVTGTAGKGSVTSLLHEAIRLSGKHVGSFTSPFVVSSIEMIRVDDQYIAPEVFAEILEELKPLIDQAAQSPYGAPSSFEILLTMAFISFKRQQCEWMILEAGAGGRYDATNVIPNPVITTITNIDYDHTSLLGKTLKKIAYNKAGIIKPGCTFFTTERRPTLLRLFEEICDQQRATFVAVPSKSSYQETNTALVTAMIQHLGFREEFIQKAVEHLPPLPGRFEQIQTSPKVILDGAHNRTKIATTVENLRRSSYRHLILVLGISQDKDSSSILSQLIPLAEHVFFTRFQNVTRPCAHPKNLQEIAQPYLKPETITYLTLDPHRALQQALQVAKPDDLILITGSFYLVGELRKHWIPEEQLLTLRRETTL